MKNLLFTEKITPLDACFALWNLADEITDSAHYERGTSVIIDALLQRVAEREEPS